MTSRGGKNARRQTEVKLLLGQTLDSEYYTCTHIGMHMHMHDMSHV